MKGPAELTVYETLHRAASSVTVARVRGARGEGVLKTAAAGSSAGRRLENEAAILRRLGHRPHLPRLLDAGVDDGVVWLLLHDHGVESLSERWARKAPGFEEALDVLEQVGRALATLHGEGIVHRDVKESNVVVGPEGLTLIDFDISRQLQGRERTMTQQAGTVGRMAPERFDLTRVEGPPTDIWPLCVMLIEGMKTVLSAPLPRDLDDTVRMLGLDPADRRHRGLARLLQDGQAADPRRRPSAQALLRRVRAIRSGRVPPRHAGAVLKAGLGLATLAGVALAARHWPTPETVTLGFEDATSAWGLDALPAEFLGAEGAGYFGVPAWMSGGRVLLPRTPRLWKATPPILWRDLVFSVTEGWSLAGSADTTWAAGFADEVLLLNHTGTADRFTLGSSAPQPGSAWMLPGGELMRRVDGLVLRDGWAPLEGVNPVGWLDLDRDGAVEVFVAEPGGAPAVWTSEGLLALGLLPPVGSMLLSYVPHYLGVGDLDGDGDLDVTYVGQQGRVMMLERDGGHLVPRVLDLPPQPPASTLEGVHVLQVVDLDADGLPELIVPAGGFHSGGNPPTRILHNLGGLRFEAVENPPSFSEAHDGSMMLVGDVDGDGLRDLLDFSINDRNHLTPTHRGWRTTSLAAPRFVALPSVPLGSVLSALDGPPWTEGVRDAAPVTAPDWVELPLLVESGSRLGLLDREGLRWLPSPRFEVEAEATALREGPVVQRQGIVWLHGEPIGGGLLRLGPDQVLVLRSQPAGGQVLERWEGGQLAASASGDQYESAVVDGDELVLAVAGALVRRDLLTLELLGEIVWPDPRPRCEGLGVAGEQLACVSRSQQALLLLEGEELRRVPLGASVSGALLRDGDRWLVASDRGIEVVGPDGVSTLWIGPITRLDRYQDRIWAVSEHRIVVLEDLAPVAALIERDVGDFYPRPVH